MSCRTLCGSCIRALEAGAGALRGIAQEHAALLPPIDEPPASWEAVRELLVRAVGALREAGRDRPQDTDNGVEMSEKRLSDGRPGG